MSENRVSGQKNEFQGKKFESLDFRLNRVSPKTHKKISLTTYLRGRSVITFTQRWEGGSIRGKLIRLKVYIKRGEMGGSIFLETCERNLCTSPYISFQSSILPILGIIAISSGPWFCNPIAVLEPKWRFVNQLSLCQPNINWDAKLSIGFLNADLGCKMAYFGSKTYLVDIS